MTRHGYLLGGRDDGLGRFLPPVILDMFALVNHHGFVVIYFKIHTLLLSDSCLDYTSTL